MEHLSCSQQIYIYIYLQYIYISMSKTTSNWIKLASAHHCVSMETNSKQNTHTLPPVYDIINLSSSLNILEFCGKFAANHNSSKMSTKPNIVLGLKINCVCLYVCVYMCVKLLLLPRSKRPQDHSKGGCTPKVARVHWTPATHDTQRTTMTMKVYRNGFTRGLERLWVGYLSSVQGLHSHKLQVCVQDKGGHAQAQP